jgi:hypothetical protein
VLDIGVNYPFPLASVNGAITTGVPLTSGGLNGTGLLIVANDTNGALL